MNKPSKKEIEMILKQVKQHPDTIETAHLKRECVSFLSDALRNYSEYSPDEIQMYLSSARLFLKS